MSCAPLRCLEEKSPGGTPTLLVCVFPFFFFFKATTGTSKDKDHHKGMLNVGTGNYFDLPEPILEVFTRELKLPG